MTELPASAVSALSTLLEPIPRSVVLATWVNSWLDGHSSADEIIEALGVFGPQRMRTHPDERGEGVGLLVGLADLGLTPRTQNARLRVVLPAPGDPSGLPGPSAVNQHAIAVGQAVVIDDLHTALLPAVAEELTTWTSHATPTDAFVSPRIRTEESSRAVRTALHEATMELSAVDFAGGRDAVTDALKGLHARLRVVPLPQSLPGPEQHTIHTSAQILGICEIALGGAPDAPTARVDHHRRTVLTELATTARHCLAAAASAR